MSNRQSSLGTKQGKLQFLRSSGKMQIFVQEEKIEIDRDLSIYRHFFHYVFLTFQDIFPEKCIERKILSLIIKCPSEGCEWTGELREKEVSVESEWCVQLTVGCPAC